MLSFQQRANQALQWDVSAFGGAAPELRRWASRYLALVSLT